MLRKISIGKRSTIAFFLMGAIVLVIAILSSLRLNQLNDEITTIAADRVPALRASSGIMANLYRFRLQNAYLMDANAQTAPKFEQKLQEAKTLVDQYIKDMRELAKTAKAKQLIDSVEASIDRFYALQREQRALVQANNHDAAMALQMDKMVPLGEEVAAEVKALVEFQVQQINESDKQTDAVFAQSLTIIGVISLAAIVLVIILAARFTTSLMRPIRMALSVAESIADGDLTQRIEDDGDDELAQMVQALAKMQTNLRQAIEEIKDSSDMLASTAEELSIVTHQSTNGINEQNQQLEMSVSAVTELTAAIAEVARNAVSTSHESEMASDKADEGKKQVDNTIADVEDVIKNLKLTENGLDGLVLEIKKISTVLDVIGTIADQTNLLALNAAIEAARAGESGRGFAVVADEVRALAYRTQESTQEIETMINSIQAGAKTTVESMETSQTSAQKTLVIATAAGDALEEITQSVARISEQNDAIAISAEQQATVSNEVDKSLVTIKDLNGEIVAGANQTHSSSSELARLAENLRVLTNRFTV
ncbi:methyl-accepting chemotaxis protein [Alteromonas pelagimontana]|uniref:Methyl-accepting chemotaxis protein n=1 Tax=Alteromonas pelagimontana TaxID=1858656 RepID=A0A6M4MF16_9ALTE|nr:methyl-accepting chemotaxis protein [Alteromonas pelagimontana]QJR81673.1 methyl-accepting chemotaxis protein [Alteromonas pelagimontana]